MALATCLGFPRIGSHRELKKTLEGYWSKKLTAIDVRRHAAELRARHWTAMKAAGIDHIPSNDFSLYDHVLDTAVMLGVVPARFRTIADETERYFAMARGLQDAATGTDVAALEMTKWFDTNYHYLVPELEPHQAFAIDPSRLLGEIDQARSVGVEPRPVILGPISFLLLAKMAGEQTPGSPLAFVDAIVAAYERLLQVIGAAGVTWLQIDEPCLVTDLDREARLAYQRALSRLSQSQTRPNLMLATYFGDLGDNLPLALHSGFEALHVDAVRAPDQLDPLLRAIDRRTILSLGIVDGRNVWRTNLDRAHALVRRVVEQLGTDRVWIAPSCSLLHVPVDLDTEETLDPELRSWLAFAAQKLTEIRTLTSAAGLAAPPANGAFAAARDAAATRRQSTKVHNSNVAVRLAAVDDTMLRRQSPFATRIAAQQARLRLPVLPTTTIGSFPQTGDVRGARAAWRAGKLSDADYQTFLRTETAQCIARQEQLGLDMLVHGEFERTDMVEHFGHLLRGFAFTEFGWVQSYGSRCVKPPILFGDVARTAAMTVDWSVYAQSLTKKPVKGMLTGPVTILQWSFVRDDQPRRDTAMQIALALRDEVCDLERAGIAAIQVDEPAIREGLPLRRREHAAYLRWAVDAFKLATCVVRDDTQIHTHMCYAEFGAVLDAIAALDADVLSIETSRSRMELFSDFQRAGYPNQIGPGVYDIHSPRVPSIDEIIDLLHRARAVVPTAQLWVNPDCGLKTRNWPEVEDALAHMVTAAHRVRAEPQP